MSLMSHTKSIAPVGDMSIAAINQSATQGPPELSLSNIKGPEVKQE